MYMGGMSSATLSDLSPGTRRDDNDDRSRKKRSVLLRVAIRDVSEYV
jgi:hypothetical protein